MRSFWELLQQVSAGIQDERPMLFLTGGMSRAPYVVAAVKQVFPIAKSLPPTLLWGSSRDWQYMRRLLKKRLRLALPESRRY